jgi:hypothetical protein
MVAKLVTQVATPDVRAWAEHPGMVVPFEVKLTVPVGVAPPPVTVAVSVVELPTADGLGDAERAVVVDPAATTMAKLDELDEA